MMAAYQPQPGAIHPGMAPHAHPSMAAGQPMNPAQMQQMGHPGAVTPGPHVTQGGAMMSMQPNAGAMGGPAAMGGQHPGGQMGGMPAQMGAQSMAGGMPNAHALSHLTPQAQAMQQQQMMQQQQLQGNPQQLQQMQQHALMQRRLQAMQANGNIAALQQNAMQNLSPQQIHQLQQNNLGMAHPQPVQLPPHLQQQQVMARIQQQQAAQQQQQQNQQMQAQLSMQHANSQQSNQSGHPTPQNQGAQAQNPAQPGRPQSRLANPNEQGQASAQPNAQQNAQQGQSQQVQQPQAQTQNQQGQQGQAGQQPGQQANPQQGQQQQPMNPQQFQIMQRQRQIQMQQQAAMQQQMQRAQPGQQQQSGNGIFILRAIQFGDHLSSFDTVTGKDIASWHAFVDRHFAAEGRFVHSFAPDANTNNREKKYEVPRATIPRYFQMYFDSNAQYVQLHLEHVRESQVAPNRHQVSFSSATFTVVYPNGARLDMIGTVRMLFAPNSDVIELMELHTEKSEEHINRAEIERLLSNWSPTMANKQSPKMTKKNLPKGQQKMQSQFEGLTIDHFPKTPKAPLGAPDRVQHFFEITEPMSLMADLIAFAQDKRLRPEQALNALVQEYETRGDFAAQQGNQQGNPQINLPQNGVPVGNRTPSMQNMQMANAQAGGQFSSPSVSNLNLPMQNGIAGMNGSPHIANNTGLAPNMNLVNSHTPSPHQTNMAAPPMVPQHSQQGTNSSAASANTSPNVNNKRRRSTVKLEGDDSTAEAAGRVKPSPRMPKKSKPGG